MSYLFLIFLCLAQKGANLPLYGVRVLFIVPQNNFNDEEYRIPKEILSQLGAEITVASEDTTEATGMFELSLKPEVRIGDISFLDYEVTVLIGGSGSVSLFNDGNLHKNLISADSADKIIGAISLAPVILARAGLLKGRRATIGKTPWAKKLLLEMGAIYTGQEVERDGNIVTAAGLRGEKPFVDELIAVITEKRGDSSE
ncbi:DJ-1/PfpI family protein [candidate division WOR-3 bacterium]|nr:DJ-1/PfpI family protein [candidate division WOR-3 bacterium]